MWLPTVANITVTQQIREAQSYAVQPEPSCNLRPDLVVGHRDGGVTFFEGKADSTFQLRADLTDTGLGVIQDLASGDFDGDGDLDLAVSGGDRVTVLFNPDDPLTVSPIANGNFAHGLTGWISSGTVSATGGFAQMLEGESFLTSLWQTFVVPETPQTIAFDIVALGLENVLAGSCHAGVWLTGREEKSLVAYTHALTSLQSFMGNPLLKCGPHDFTEAACGAALFAVRRAAYEVLLSKHGLWCQLVALYAAGHWPCGILPNKQVVVY